MINKIEVKTISGISGASFGTYGFFSIKADSGTLSEINNLISVAPETLKMLKKMLELYELSRFMASLPASEEVKLARSIINKAEGR